MIFRWRCDHTFKVYICIILTRSNWIFFKYVVPWRFWKRPAWIFLFNPVLERLISSRTRCFWQYHRAVHVSSHNSTYFWVDLLLTFVLSWTWNKTKLIWIIPVVFHLQPWAKSIAWILLAAIFKNSIFEIIRAWPWHFTRLILNSRIMGENSSSFLDLELWNALVLAGSWLRL